MSDNLPHSPSAWTVTLEPSGRAFSVAPDQTILEASLEQSVKLPYGCQQGTCGACKCQLRDGQVKSLGQHPLALSPEERNDGWILACRSVPQSDLRLLARQVVEDDELPVRRLPARIVEMRPLAPEVMLLRLQLPGAEAFRYKAGQYVDFLLRDGSRRSYSMANDVDTGGPNGLLEFHIRHLPGGVFTDQLFSRMKERDLLRLEGPFGSVHLDAESSRPLLFLAAGTGFAPIKAMLEQLRRLRSARPIVLYRGARTLPELYMDEWVNALRTELPQLRYEPVLSDLAPDDPWTGRRGFVHAALVQDWPDLGNCEVYACGAPVVIAAARTACAQAGLPSQAFVADAFTSRADQLPVLEPV